MSDIDKNLENEQPQEKKKMTLQEAMRLKLESKKQEQGKHNATQNSNQSSQKMKNQATKKSTMHRRTGGE